METKLLIKKMMLTSEYYVDADADDSVADDDDGDACRCCREFSAER